MQRPAGSAAAQSAIRPSVRQGTYAIQMLSLDSTGGAVCNRSERSGQAKGRPFIFCQRLHHPLALTPSLARWCTTAACRGAGAVPWCSVSALIPRCSTTSDSDPLPATCATFMSGSGRSGGTCRPPTLASLHRRSRSVGEWGLAPAANSGFAFEHVCGWRGVLTAGQGRAAGSSRLGGNGRLP